MTITFTKQQLTRYIRNRIGSHLFDESDMQPLNSAIYTLSDPRDIREVRYVGQTRSPRSRYLQHLRAARLWMPDEVPWWIKEPRLRPLYTWIRNLYQDDRRLPVMVVSEWVESRANALSAERTKILVCAGDHMQLFNVESERVGTSIPMLLVGTENPARDRPLQNDLALQLVANVRA